MECNGVEWVGVQWSEVGVRWSEVGVRWSEVGVRWSEVGEVRLGRAYTRVG